MITGEEGFDHVCLIIDIPNSQSEVPSPSGIIKIVESKSESSTSNHIRIFGKIKEGRGLDKTIERLPLGSSGEITHGRVTPWVIGRNNPNYTLTHL